jgi:hypothetical protein
MIPTASSTAVSALTYAGRLPFPGQVEDALAGEGEHGGTGAVLVGGRAQHHVVFDLVGAGNGSAALSVVAESIDVTRLVMIDAEKLVGTVFSGLSALVIEGVEDAGEAICVRARTRDGAVGSRYALDWLFSELAEDPEAVDHADDHQAEGQVALDGHRSVEWLGGCSACISTTRQGGTTLGVAVLGLIIATAALPEPGTHREHLTCNHASCS